MTGKLKVGVAIASAVAVVASLGGGLWMNRPFQAELGSYRTSLADRTEAQRHNIRQAVKALDGLIIESGDTFSFNSTVGPRTLERGYRAATAYMERDLVASIGGGVCQVSSTVYNAATRAGFDIVERHAHFRRVASVLPGQDATVWYGLADLRFLNSSPFPAKLLISTRNENFAVSLVGRKAGPQRVRVKFASRDLSPTGNKFVVETVRETITTEGSSRMEVLSFDIYSY